MWTGTAGWSYKDWVGPFYPEGTRASEMLRHYVARFRCVELDSSFYGTPRLATVESWHARLPDGFLMCPKFPKAITHDRFLTDCDAELDEFLGAICCLRSKLGPLLLQFRYWRKAENLTVADLVARLAPFLDRCLARAPLPIRLVVEVRNRAFLVPQLLDALQERGVALAVTDHAYMPDPDAVLGRDDLWTAPFSYLRLLGDRQAIERITKTWSREVLDQGWRLDVWAQWVRRTMESRDVFVLANNHYAGFAPSTIRRLEERLVGTL